MMEDRIAILCGRMLGAKDFQEIQALAQELQGAIHNHVEELRAKLSVIPVLPNE